MSSVSIKTESRANKSFSLISLERQIRADADLLLLCPSKAHAGNTTHQNILLKTQVMLDSSVHLLHCL